MSLFENEKLEFHHPGITETVVSSDNDINEKYIKGEVRIITEQARYPLNTIVSMIDSDDYELDPEFQRRHRWDNTQKSRLIESFIMNVPIPPIFLYEDSYSHYQVMDGLQRLTAIYDFYTDELVLEGLQEWPELNGRSYSVLPEQIKKGVDRRYLSSIILLQETAKDKVEADRLKQLVFERINSGGIQLAPQESRNAIYDGPLNRLCIKLSRNKYLCKMWKIPEPTQEEIENGTISDDLLKNDSYRKMSDVELVLRFFAYRQRKFHDTSTLYRYFNNYLNYGNDFPQEVLVQLEALFLQTTKLIYEIFGDKAFCLYRLRNRNWSWYSRPATAIYDPMMFVFSNNISKSDKLLSKKESYKKNISEFYKSNYEIFEGRNVNPGILDKRDEAFKNFIESL